MLWKIYLAAAVAGLSLVISILGFVPLVQGNKMDNGKTGGVNTLGSGGNQCEFSQFQVFFWHFQVVSGIVDRVTLWAIQDVASTSTTLWHITVCGIN